MSHPTSTVQVTVTGAAVSPSLPTAGFVEASYGLLVYDPSTYTIEDNWYGIIASLVTNSDNTAYRSSFAAVAGTDDVGKRWTINDVMDLRNYVSLDAVFGTTNVYSVVLNDNGAAYFGGGTLSIEKDFDNNHIVFSCQGGTFTAQYSWDGNPFHVGIANSAGPDPFTPSPGLSGIYEALFWNHTAATENASATWKNFYFYKGASLYFGAAMTIDDPGIWHEVEPTAADNDNDIPGYDSQGASSYTTKLQGTNPGPDDGIAFPVYAETRLFYGQTNGYGLAPARSPEHGTIFLAYTGPGDLTKIRANRSFDNGKTWQTSTIVPAGGTATTGTGCDYANGRLYVVWYDIPSRQVNQVQSIDLGITWSSPVPLTFTGANPALIIDPNNGIFFYFYQDTITGNLKLQRSGDAGATMIDTTPITVISGIAPQTIGAEFGSDGTVVVSYVAAGVINQIRSRDYGTTWA